MTSSNNPLLQKYEEIHKNKESPRNVHSYLSSEDIKLINTLRNLIEDIKTGKAFYNNYEVKNNYKRVRDISFWSNQSSTFDIIPLDTGQMINIEVFRKYD